MSIVKTNKFQTLDGMTYNVPIQVVTSSLGSDLGTTDTSTSDRTNLTPSWLISTTSTTWTDTTNLQLTITPKFSNSLIKLDLSMYAGVSTATAESPAIRIKRGNKIVYRPALTSGGAPYGHAYISPNTGTIASYFQHFFTAYDAPGTTSPVTYTIQYRSFAGGTCVFFAASGNYASCNFLVATEFAQ